MSELDSMLFTLMSFWVILPAVLLVIGGIKAFKERKFNVFLTIGLLFLVVWALFLLVGLVIRK